ncbi:MAG: hypothetical protein LWX51_04990 [Deltaproteobacteria bacterium]|jgi:hypothetical protein|nr:hypothetical protein [Deltaproteobacteria bacterium]
MSKTQPIRRSSGLNMEKIKITKTRKGNPIYSIRITRSFRATLTIEDPFILITIPHNAPLSIVNNYDATPAHSVFFNPEPITVNRERLLTDVGY